MLSQSRAVAIATVVGADRGERQDSVAVEEPLEIRLRTGTQEAVPLSITMRTPGNDDELGAGFLWSEGILTDPKQILRIEASGPIQAGGWRNIVTVTVDETLRFDPVTAARRFYMTSSCGICGKASLEVIEAQRLFEISRSLPIWSAHTIHSLPDTLRAAQATFEQTGGLHAAGLFDCDGNVLAVREDVGRHNAVDKLVGAAVLSQTLPLSNALLLVSGRASFELVQKAVMAGIPALAAVGAPSSLAVELAKDANLTLLGFVRANRFNIYSGDQRIRKDGTHSQ